MEKLIKLYASKFGMHSQAKQGIVQQYYNNLKGFFKSIENGKILNPLIELKNSMKSYIKQVLLN